MGKAGATLACLSGGNVVGIRWHQVQRNKNEEEVEMARSFVRYSENGTPKWGELAGPAPKHPDDIVSVNVLKHEFVTIAQLVEALDSGDQLEINPEPVQFSARSILSPVTNDVTVICQGLNYSDHSSDDAGITVRKNNLLFSKAASSLCGPYDKVIKPAGVEMLDYEIEVGVILRRSLDEGAVVTSENLGEYLAGVVLCNDISARDVMFGNTYMQWMQGKSYRTFLPAGPVFYWLEKDEVVEALENLKISLTWRDEVRQTGVTSQMIFKPTETLTFIATIMNLGLGDLLVTGTPGGVIAKGTPRINEILKEYMLDDATRRALFTEEAHATVSDFMQVGDLMTSEMSDERGKGFLGGQYTEVG